MIAITCRVGCVRPGRRILAFIGNLRDRSLSSFTSSTGFRQANIALNQNHIEKAGGWITSKTTWFRLPVLEMSLETDRAYVSNLSISVRRDAHELHTAGTDNRAC